MFRMTVADVFSIRGRGTVVTGSIEEGSVAAGDLVRINDGQPISVDGIEVSGTIIDRAQAPDTAGLLFRALEREGVKRGDVISAG